MSIPKGDKIGEKTRRDGGKKMEKGEGERGEKTR